MRASRWLLVGVVAMGAFVTSTASAQKSKTSKVTELGEIVISARVQKPVAAFEINRIRPSLSLSELRQPFLDRIEQAIYADPF